MAHQTILVLDFGSQYTQLIARRLREHAVYAEILPFDTPADAIRARKPAGLILSGGPASVTDANAPQCETAVFELGLPVLGICYGMQLMTIALGGSVAGAPEREFGHALITIKPGSPILPDGHEELRVWASHGDAVTTPPPGFTVRATSANAPVAAMDDSARRLHALLFHPEVAHTDRGSEILRAFAYDVCACTGDWTMESLAIDATARIRAAVGPAGRVVCGLSGGVDSTVTAVLVHRAIGDRLTCIVVDNGVLRLGEVDEIRRGYADKLQLPVVVEDASELFLVRLAGVTDPEEKRKLIGRTFIEVFEQAAARMGEVDFLAQGTLYPDVIESTAVVGPSAAIKSHHNVGGLPAQLRFALIEPLRMLFKDEVRALGIQLGIDAELIWRQPFPGPGLAVRILGEVTRERILLLQRADAIVAEEIKRAGRNRQLWQSFAILLPVRSVGVMGDERTYQHMIAIRAVESRDGMTADWARLPHDLLANMSSRIVNEVQGINRVVYDISSKPPATIEWE